MGVPRSDVETFKAWSDCVMTLVFGVAKDAETLAGAQQGLVELRDYLTDLARRYREHPAENLISELAAAVDEDDRLSIEEIVPGPAGVRRTGPAGAHPERLAARRLRGGVHYCLGAPIARLEGRIALDRLVRRFPRIGLGNGEPSWHPALVSRGMSAFRVRLEAS